MKLRFISICQNDSKPAKQLTGVLEGSQLGFFQKAPAKQFSTFICQHTANKTRPGERQCFGKLDDNEVPPPRDPEDPLSDPENVVHSYARSEGICVVAITDQDYKPLIASAMLSKIADEFLTKYPRAEWEKLSKSPEDIPWLVDFLKKYQDPAQVDSIAKIQGELDETKIVLHKAINSVLERGEKLDDLVAKSDVLSASSKMFYTQAKKQNSCCSIM